MNCPSALAVARNVLGRPHRERQARSAVAPTAGGTQADLREARNRSAFPSRTVRQNRARLPVDGWGRPSGRSSRGLACRDPATIPGLAGAARFVMILDPGPALAIVPVFVLVLALEVREH